MGLVSAMFEILQRPTIAGVVGELMMFMAPLWIAVIVGVLVGWSWRPKWADLGRELLVSSVSSTAAAAAATMMTTMVAESSSPPPSSDDTPAATSSSSSSSEDKDSQSLIDFSLIPSFNSLKLQLPSCISWISDDGLAKDSSLTECRFVEFSQIMPKSYI